jgi:hypothetical protein
LFFRKIWALLNIWASWGFDPPRRAEENLGDPSRPQRLGSKAKPRTEEEKEEK